MKSSEYSRQPRVLHFTPQRDVLAFDTIEEAHRYASVDASINGAVEVLNRYPDDADFDKLIDIEQVRLRDSVYEQALVARLKDCGV